MTRHCPLCGLNFRFFTELESHARDDHVTLDMTERDERIIRFRRSGRVLPSTYPISM